MARAEEAQAWWQLPTTQQTLQQARDADWVVLITSLMHLWRELSPALML